MAGQVYLSRFGYQKLVEQLEFLKITERQRIAKAIGEARAQGDISENAEYDAAKDAQAHNEARIAEIEGKLVNVAFIEDLNIPADKVFIGATVELTDLDLKEKLTYRLASPEEVEFYPNGLSVFSPIGKGLLTRKAGDEVTITVPAGVKRYKILSVKRTA
ncbi:MAG: transcription elongation factor GreA [Candidatus Omnitrophica bacterium]|nr:transcription elongation factor GreA [Candidatus Omnitrophota bacterium]